MTTTPLESTATALITAAVTEIANNRAVIDQAKGMLILVYGVDENGAFEMLRWRSQSTNTKLRTLAAQLVADYRSHCNGEALPSRAVYEQRADVRPRADRRRRIENTPASPGVSTPRHRSLPGTSDAPASP